MSDDEQSARGGACARVVMVGFRLRGVLARFTRRAELLPSSIASNMPVSAGPYWGDRVFPGRVETVPRSASASRSWKPGSLSGSSPCRSTGRLFCTRSGLQPRAVAARRRRQAARGDQARTLSKAFFVHVGDPERPAHLWVIEWPPRWASSRIESGRHAVTRSPPLSVHGLDRLAVGVVAESRPPGGGARMNSRRSARR